ncbi:hypothetical protein MMC27_003799 [Xylographa pallens]|nr:hypothetical protein [Xylographa pallens]
MGSTEHGPQGQDWATEPIAVTGLSCKLAGDASDAENLWSMLAEGCDAWSEIPPSRFDLKGAYHADPDRLGTAIDPQYRMQLESVYEAFENAGLPLSRVTGSNTSVYAGVWTHDYHDGLIQDGDKLPRFLMIGTPPALAANRISHFFDLRGASLTLDTGCLSGLVALHQAMAAAYYRAAMAWRMTQERGTGIKGAIVAVGVGEAAAHRDFLDKLVDADGTAVVACINSPSSVTIAGDERAMDRVLDLANEAGIFTRRLKVLTAYHSHHMKPLAEPYRQALAAALAGADEDNKVAASFSSPVTGGRITNGKELASADHWVASLLQPVEFVDAFTDIVLGGAAESGASNIDVILEVGPHTALGGPIKKLLSQPAFQGVNVPYMGCLVRNENALLLAATWNLHTHFAQPGSLDFFVMLSSLSATLGWASQGNYAAGGSYQDAFARWRCSMGLPAVSLDLGMVKGVGYVSESRSVLDRVNKGGQSMPLSDEDVTRALGASVLDPFARPQILLGLNSGPGPH